MFECQPMQGVEPGRAPRLPRPLDGGLLCYPDGGFASVFLIGIDWYSIALGWGRYRLCIVRYQITARVDYAWAETNRSNDICYRP